MLPKYNFPCYLIYWLVAILTTVIWWSIKSSIVLSMLVHAHFNFQSSLSCFDSLEFPWWHKHFIASMVLLHIAPDSLWFIVRIEKMPDLLYLLDRGYTRKWRWLCKLKAILGCGHSYVKYKLLFIQTMKNALRFGGQAKSESHNRTWWRVHLTYEVYA